MSFLSPRTQDEYLRHLSLESLSSGGSLWGEDGNLMGFERKRMASVGTQRQKERE